MVLGHRLTDEEAAVYRDQVTADVVLVWGEEMDGTPTPRAIRATSVSTLIGRFGEGFDIRGPQATLCSECGELLVSDRGDSIIMLQQRHLLNEHQMSVPLLP